MKFYLIGVEPVVPVMLSQKKTPENCCCRVDRMGNNPGTQQRLRPLTIWYKVRKRHRITPSGRQHEVLHQDLLVLLVQDISSYTQLLQHKLEELDPKTLLSMSNRTLQPILRNNLLI